MHCAVEIPQFTHSTPVEIPLLLEQPLQLNFASVMRHGVSLMMSMFHAYCANLQRRPMVKLETRESGVQTSCNCLF